MSGEAGRELPYDKTDATLYYFKGRGLADQVRWMLAFSGVTYADVLVAHCPTWFVEEVRELLLTS